jgi:hypothetical protein
VFTLNIDIENPIVVGALFIIKQPLTSTILAVNNHNNTILALKNHSGTCKKHILKISEPDIGLHVHSILQTETRIESNISIIKQHWRK